MGFGAPPTSPVVFTAHYGLYEVVDGVTAATGDLLFSVTIPYDNATFALQDAITTHRDVGCPWSRFVVSPGTGAETAMDVPEGDSTLPLSSFTALGIDTREALENAGYTAT